MGLRRSAAPVCRTPTSQTYCSTYCTPYCRKTLGYSPEPSSRRIRKSSLWSAVRCGGGPDRRCRGRPPVRGRAIGCSVSAFRSLARRGAHRPHAPASAPLCGGLLHEGKSPTVPGPPGDAVQSISGGWRRTGAGTAEPVLLDRGVGMHGDGWRQLEGALRREPSLPVTRRQRLWSESVVRHPAMRGADDLLGLID
jgi:hypothetical protein